MVALVFGLPLTLAPPVVAVMLSLQFMWHLLHGKDAFRKDMNTIILGTVALIAVLSFINPAAVTPLRVIAILFGLHMLVNYLATTTEKHLNIAKPRRAGAMSRIIHPIEPDPDKNEFNPEDYYARKFALGNGKIFFTSTPEEKTGKNAQRFMLPGFLMKFMMIMRRCTLNNL